MAQQMMTCARCGRERYETRGHSVRSHGVTFWVCYAKASCKIAARDARGQG